MNKSRYIDWLNKICCCNHRLISYPIILLFIGCIATIKAHAQCFSCAMAPPGTIWCDDFEDSIPLAQKYFEYNNDDGDFIRLAGAGRNNSYGMRVIFQPGEEEAGNLKKSFGRTPGAYISRTSVNATQQYSEIFWRIDIRMQPGWAGNPFKLSRATSLVDSTWAQGMMAHIWSGGKGFALTMDPASGIDTSGNILSTRYNDFGHLRWLGFKGGNIPLFDTRNAGNWYCIEGHAKLNTPGQQDGIFEFWVNDTLQAGSYNLNWHGSYNAVPGSYMINAVFFENYWNNGSPVQQERYFDNIVISTKRIGCACRLQHSD